MTDRARSEFQAWWSRQDFNAQFEDVKQQMENVWVASREECVVELPKKVEAPWSNSYDAGIAATARAIEAVGLKVKP